MEETELFTPVLFPPVLFTPVLFPGATRVRLRISRRDWERFADLPPVYGVRTTVTDMATGVVYEVNRAGCGVGCFCDAHATVVES